MKCLHVWQSINDSWSECKICRWIQIKHPDPMKSSTTDQYAADAQLQRDIEAARGVKPEPNECATGYMMRATKDSAHHDPVNAPTHYRSHPSGIECIQITEHMGFNLGNAIKYIWRADLKGDAIEDLKKAVWYIEREIKKRAK